MKYRAEIDGLRAIAVIAVVLFHAGFSSFSGGFVGVDVFFVMSGYLITAIMLAQLEKGTFSLLTFYERRARRILPALFLVVLVTMILAWFWLRPPDMKDLAQSLIAVPYFSSNVWFWLESGYWGTANALKPLLHTWTLAIEAQYYFIFPLYLLAIWRWGKRWLWPSLLATTAASFVIAQWGAYHIPVANFFLLPGRWWELALGAIIAVFLAQKRTIPGFFESSDYLNLTHEGELLNPSDRHPLKPNLCSALGLGLILYSIVGFDETVPFPSAYTLVPTVGTSLIILFASATTWVGKILRTSFLVQIGLISYSAYLWHQPLFAFARHRSLTEPSQLTIITLTILVFPLAYLSWKFVENPFRASGRVHRRAIFLLWLFGSIALVEIGVAGAMTNGFIGRMPSAPSIIRTVSQIPTATDTAIDLAVNPPTTAIAQVLSANPLPTPQIPYFGEALKSAAVISQAQVSSPELPQPPTPPSDPNPPALSIEQLHSGLSERCDGPFSLLAECRTSDTPEILVWGDSFAMHLIPGILASNPNAKIIQMTQSVCGPLFDVAPISEPEYPPSWAKDCLAFTGNVRDWLHRNDTVKYAVLSSPFFKYLLDDSVIILRTGEHVLANLELAVSEFENTLNELKSLGIEPIIFSPPPANGIDLGRCLANANWRGLSPEKCNFRPDDMLKQRQVTYQFLEAIAAKGYNVVWLNQLMCDQAMCHTYQGETGLYKDTGHLSNEGSAWLGKMYDFYGMITNPDIRVEVHQTASINSATLNQGRFRESR